MCLTLECSEFDGCMDRLANAYAARMVAIENAHRIDNPASSPMITWKTRKTMAKAGSEVRIVTSVKNTHAAPVVFEFESLMGNYTQQIVVTRNGQRVEAKPCHDEGIMGGMTDREEILISGHGAHEFSISWWSNETMSSACPEAPALPPGTYALQLHLYSGPSIPATVHLE